MDQVSISRELLLQVLDAFETYAKQYPGMWKGYLLDAEQALRTALEQPAVEPVAEVVYLERGGNAGIATRIVEIDSPNRDRLQAETKLYTAPQAQPAPVQEPIGVVSETWSHWPNSGNEPCVEWAGDAAPPVGTKLYAAPQAHPRKAVKLSDSEIEKLQYEHVGVTKWFPNLARAIEQAVLKKNGIEE